MELNDRTDDDRTSIQNQHAVIFNCHMWAEFQSERGQGFPTTSDKMRFAFCCCYFVIKLINFHYAFDCQTDRTGSIVIKLQLVNHLK
jgi:hypothetical protein